ncbi:hypothetical protein P3T23_006966, partial [Paraburkholderia sp. GAS448]
AGGSTGRNGRKFASLYIESACSRIRSGNDRFSWSSGRASKEKREAAMGDEATFTLAN